MSECGVLFDLDIKGAPQGPLQNKTFVVKDFFDVEGFVTGCGNPDWRSTHAAAGSTAISVKRLLDAGAHLIGKACTDELACSLDGINPHYGTPLNTQLPDRIPGGSSSGSASAVAAGFSDFGIGTDTVGSVRVPASYCGIFGMRPTHGVIDSKGVVPLGESFDTVGWLARDASLLSDVGTVLLGHLKRNKITSACVARNLFNAIPVEIGQHLLWACESVLERVGTASEVEISDNVSNACSAIFSTIRSCEAGRNFGHWIETEHPHVSPPVMLRVTEGRVISSEEEAMMRKLKAEMEKYFEDLIEHNGVILLPTAWEMPPLKTSTKEELARNRANNIRLTALSPVTGLPQVSIPVEISPGVKLGLGIMAGRNCDLDLLELVQTAPL